jgi:alginate O-acetyltransferase complex protein AlgJ
MTDVHVGSDGWLFLRGGSNNVEQLFSDPNFIQSTEIEAWKKLLIARREKLDRLGAQYVHLCVPDKLSVYRENLAGLELLHPTPLSIIFSPESVCESDNGFVDILPAMLEAKKTRQLYFKTDTHWTYWGACVAHKVLCNTLNAKPPIDLYDRPIDEIMLTLDLGSKLTPAVKELWHAARILRHSKLVYKNSMARFLDLLAPRHYGEMHGGVSVGFENASNQSDPRKLLIFGDSYSEFRPHSLTGLLAETFQSVRFVWSNSIDYGLVERLKPEIVVTEIAERFVKRVPDDTLDLGEMVYERITAFLNNQCKDDREFRFTWANSTRPSG